MKKFALICIAILCKVISAEEGTIFDVMDYGAVGDGHTDDTQAFSDAWEKACGGNNQNATLHIPSNTTFLLHQIVFKGPCKGIINVNIEGTLVAPSALYEYEFNDDGESKKWISFESVDGLAIGGGGTVDGTGSIWWDRSCWKNKRCPKAPTALVIQNSDNVTVNNLNLRNSPQMHMALEESTNVIISGVDIKSPSDSPNTDGIHIQQSQFIQILSSTIGTGDDCISIGPGSSYVNISGITCGPGHGISIGSLGEKNGDNDVNDIYVANCMFNGTSNGARIKTKPGGSGYVRNVVFEQLQMNDVRNPIIINQYYVDHHKHDHFDDQDSKAVKISGVTYDTIAGTSRRSLAVVFNCSEIQPCTGIVLSDINLDYTSDGNQTYGDCANVEGYYRGEVVPRVRCLEAVNRSDVASLKKPSTPSLC